MKNYAMIAKYSAMKGFFKKRVAAEYLIVGFKDNKNDSFILIQFFDRLKEGLYICAIVAGAESPDDEALEQELDSLRYSSQFEILEDKLPVGVKFGRSIKITFNKPSKYVGKTLELVSDSRLPEGYLVAKCKLKKGFEPSQHYNKVDSDAMGSGSMDQLKKMRAFTSSRLKSIMKK